MSFSWLKNIKTKKTIFSVLLIIVISSLGIFVLGAREAQAAIDCSDPLIRNLPGFDAYCGGKWIVEKGLNFLIDISLEVLITIVAKFAVIIHSIFSIFFWIAATFLQITFSIADFTKAGVVQAGWALTRGLVNLFFILALMVIAFATILRLGSYGLKSALPKLLIAALLINFSLVIAGVIIDFSQVLTQFFLPDRYGPLGEHLASITNIQKEYEINNQAKIGEKLAAGVGGMLMVIVSLFLGIFLILAATVIIGLGAFLLIVRAIALWILLILAPLAWFFWILPATQKLWNDWWRSFLKWTFFAPVYAFFVYLALVTADGGGFNNIISDEMKKIVDADGWAKTFTSVLTANIRLLLQFVAILGLLVGGLIAGQKLSLYGADGTMKVAKWVGKGAAGGVSRWQAGGAKFPSLAAGFRKIKLEKLAKATETVSKYTGIQALGRAKQKAAVWTSPGAWRRAWPEISKERERRAYTVRSAELQDQLTAVFSLGREKGTYAERTKRQQRIEERKKIFTINADELVENFKRAFEAGLPDIAAANAQALAEQGDLNDLLEKGYGYEFNAKGISEFAEKRLKPLLGEQDTYRLMFDLNRATEKVGQWPGRVFKAEYDSAKGRVVYKNIVEELGIADGTKEAMKQAYLAWSRMDPQEKARFTHRLGIISENKKGENLGVDGHEMWIRGFSAAPGNVVRMQDEVVANLMLRHAEETHELNPELFKQLSEKFEKMDDEQIDEIERMLQPVAPGVQVSTWIRGGGILIR